MTLTPPTLPPHESAIFDWIDALLPVGWLALKANQPAPTAPSPLVTFQVTSFASIGTPNERVTDAPFLDEFGAPTGDFIGVRKTHYQGVCAVNAFGDNAYTVAKALYDSVDDKQVGSVLAPSGLILRDASDLIDVSAWVQTSFEAQWRFEVTFGWAENVQYQIGAVDTIVADTTFDP